MGNIVAQIISIPSLPSSIQEKIPISIRSASDTYYINELPPKIQELIREVVDENTIPVTYRTAYDLKPNISKYSDLEILQTAKKTVVEYLKNYFQTIPGSYPFDPSFGCKLKYHLQTKDTHLRRLLVADEINGVVNALSSDLGMPITVNNITITPMASSMNTSLICVISISIPGEEDIDITVDSLFGE